METIAIDLHDPRIPNLDEDAELRGNPFLEDFLKFCQSKLVTSLRDLEAAPMQVQNLLKAHQYRPKMMKHIMVTRGS